MRKLRAQRLVLLLGGILLAVAMLFGGAGKADAQGQDKGQGQAKGKAQAQSQGKGKAQSQIQDQVQGGDEEDDAEESGDQEKVTVCHAPPGNPENAHEITVSQRAADAHLAHHPDDAESACGDTGGGDTGSDLVGLVGTITDTDQNGTPDLLTFPATGCTVDPSATLTVEQNGQSTTFTKGEDATITSGNTALEVRGNPAGSDLGLSAAQKITVKSSTGIDCTNVTLTGTLATTSSGGVALKTEGGKGDKAVVPLVTETKAQGERLKKLAGDKKLGKVDVTGVKVTKDAKTKGAKNKGAQAKGQDRKDVLKVTSVKKANKK